MSDAQKAPAPSAETERAVEVAKGLTKRVAKAIAQADSNHGYFGATYAGCLPQDLEELGFLRWADEPNRVFPVARLTKFGRLVARSLKGEG